MKKSIPIQTTSRPPIVAVLGHVDHGKTTLLDTIRKTNVTQGEAGGITQHIGAYQITVSPKGESLSRASVASRGIPLNSQKILRQAQDDRATQGRSITFIDTPGHEAFSKMRSRGVGVADIALLVVSATDGVMPQTEEAIKHISSANIPMMVVINKIDLPEADLEKVKRQLADHGVLVEGYGGDVVVAPVSAKTGKGIPELLDTILLVAEMKGITADNQGQLEAVVIESKVDPRRGNVATVIVRNGTLHVSDTVYIEGNKTKIRALMRENGVQIESAPPGTPVAVLGWEKIPSVGMPISSQIQTIVASEEVKFAPKPFSLPPLETIKKLKIILKADVAGSLEAIMVNLKEGIDMVASGTGEISESDVLLAKSTGAIIVGFNLKVPAGVVKLATHEKVRIKTYTIIYELLTEIGEVVELLNTPQAQEDILGKATILAEFKADKDKVAGCKITEGRIVRGDLVRIIQKENEIGKVKVKSLRHGKDDISKAEQGLECGVVFDKKLDFRLGDTIIAYKIHELLS